MIKNVFVTNNFGPDLYIKGQKGGVFDDEYEVPEVK